MMHDTKALKEAHTEHDVHPLIRQRWSARAFSDRPMEEMGLRTLFEAAAWAPSPMNEQPWRYRYALKGSSAFHTLWACLNAGNKPWAEHAGALVVSIGRTHLERNAAPNHSWMHDLGMANANLLTQATSMGIYGHLMGGFDHTKVNAYLNIDPATEEVVCLIALGYLGDPDELVEPFRERELTPRTRRSLETTITAL